MRWWMPHVGPPLAVYVSYLSDLRVNDGAILGGITRGSWMRIVMGGKHSPDPAVGWVNVFLDDNQVMGKTTMATMAYKTDGTTPDPSFLKQGIYRATTWNVTHVLHFGPMLIGQTLAEVAAPKP